MQVLFDVPLDRIGELKELTKKVGFATRETSGWLPEETRVKACGVSVLSMWREARVHFRASFVDAVDLSHFRMLSIGLMSYNVDSC